ncbi:MAG TPA: PAS domain S-box protein, partial [Microlunatus sp.]|nr:PAS domain S-box protein [Microlunatus sp.]
MTPPAQATSMYRQIVECGNEGIWVFDLEGATAYVNERMAGMLGYTVEEMASISLLDVLDDVGRDQGADFLARQRRAGGTTESAECLLLRSDGKPIWTVVSHSPWQGADGTYLGLIAFVNDITERRRLSDALRRREEQLAEAQRVARLGSWEWDLTTNEIHWSDELYRVFRISPGAFDGSFEGYVPFVHPDDRRMTEEIVGACLHGDLPGFEFEQRIRGDTGHGVVWVRTSGEVLRDEAGRPTLMRGTALDITAYKEAEERLQRATSRYRLLRTMAAAANEAHTLEEVALVSVREMCAHLQWLAGRVYVVSALSGALVPVDTWQRQPGRDGALPGGVGLTFRDCAVSDLASRVLATSQVEWTAGAELVVSGPGLDELQAFAVPVRSGGEVVAVLEFVTDTAVQRPDALAICREVATQLAVVAERERTSNEIRQATDTALAALRTKSDFLATMSHEIRTPMNGVIGLTELLLSTDLDDRQGRYVEGVRAAGEALLSIINDILDFSKIEAGRATLVQTDFDVAQVIDEVAGLLARQAQGKGLELITRGPLGLPVPVRGDPARLRQVLINLTSNAIKFTDRGEVVVGARLAASSGD